MVYVNLKRELKKKKLYHRDIAEVLDLSVSAINQKMQGVISISIDEAFKIRDAFFPDKTVDYLFYDYWKDEE